MITASNSSNKYQDIRESLAPNGDFKEDYLGQSIYQRCFVDRELKDESRCKRRSFKAVSAVFSATAKVPLIPVAMTLPHGWIFATGSTVGAFALEFWAINGSIDDILEKKSPKEYVLMQRVGRGRCYQIAVFTSATALALLSQLAVALPSLDYLPHNYKIPGFTVMLVAGSLLNIRSLHLTIDKTVQCCRQKKLEEIGQEVEKFRNEIVATIQANQAIFKEMGYDKKIAYLSELNPLREENNALIIPEGYWEKILVNFSNSSTPEGAPTPEVQERLCTRICKNGGYVVGPALNVIFQIAIGEYTYAKTKMHLTSSSAGSAVITAGVLGSGVYLSTMAITMLTQRVWSSGVNVFRRRSEPSITEQLRPKLTLALKFLGILFDIAAMGPSWKIWGDFYADRGIKTQRFFQISCCTATYLFVLMATFDLLDNIILLLIKSKGKMEHQMIVKLYQELSLMQKLIKESSHLDFVTFVAELPESVKHHIQEKAETQIGQLEFYKSRLIEPITEKSRLIQ